MLSLVAASALCLCDWILLPRALVHEGIEGLLVGPSAVSSCETVVQLRYVQFRTQIPGVEPDICPELRARNASH